MCSNSSCRISVSDYPEDVCVLLAKRPASHTDMQVYFINSVDLASSSLIHPCQAHFVQL